MTARASAPASFAPSAHSSCSASEASANATTRDATTVARADSAALSAARRARHVARSENASSSSSSSSSRLPNRREAWPSPPENDAHARATTSASAATPGLTKKRSSARNARAPARFFSFSAEASHRARSAGVAPCLWIHRERADARAALSARLERQAACARRKNDHGCARVPWYGQSRFARRGPSREKRARSSRTQSTKVKEEGAESFEIC